MSKTIFYIMNPDTLEFFFYDNLDEVKNKEEELTQIFGYDTFGDTKLPKVPRQYKTLKNYYGTVWLAIKPNGAYRISDHYKDIKQDKEYGYRIKKFELEPYNNPEASYWLESNRKAKVKKAYPGVKRRSPGFD